MELEEAPARSASDVTVVRRAVLTLGLLAVYYFARWLPLPGLAPGAEVMPSFAGDLRLSALTLGIQPFVPAYLLVELLSFLPLPSGKPLRRQGLSGRRTLNRLAVALGIVLTGVQAASMAAILQQTPSPDGAPMVEEPGIAFVVVATCTLMAGVAASLALAQTITRLGLGNGIWWLLAFDWLLPLVKALPSLVLNPTGAWPPPAAELLLWVPATAAIIFLFRRGRPAMVAAPGTDAATGFRLPAFPQGVVAVNLVSTMVGWYWIFGARKVEANFNRPLALTGTVVLLAAGLWLCHHLFSSRPRVERALGLAVEPVPASYPWLAGAIVVVVTVASLAAQWWLGFGLGAILGFTGLASLVAVGFDLAAEARFRRRHGDAAAIFVELDNVHLASYLESRLRAQGIDALARTYHLRSLFFFFQPMVKMELLVPAADQGRAYEAVKPELLETV